MCWLAAGCNDAGIERQRANVPPDTRITSGPPDRTSGTSYRVQLAWLGTDPDGNVDHFEYIVVDHPAAYESTATVPVTVPRIDDPRWRATHAVDSTFVVSADSLHRDPRPGEGETPPDVLQAFFERWHTIFVRAVDVRGAVDPTPDYRTFNARTLAPTVALTAPVRPGAVFVCGPSAGFHWTGEDPLDKVSLVTPDSSRWVVIPSHVSALGEYTSFPDSLYTLPARFHWSPWHAWNDADGGGVRATVKGLEPLGTSGCGFYLLAVQAKDEAGAVTPVFDFETPGKNNVALLWASQAMGPVVTLQDPILGVFTYASMSRPLSVSIAAGQEVRFRWRGDASPYGSEVAGYRYGWDMLDPTEDSQWECGWNLDCTRLVPSRRFQNGTHRFYLQALDAAGDTTSAVLELTVVPFTRRRALLCVDDSTYPPGDALETIEDQRWAAVFDSFAVRHGLQFEPGRDVYDVADNRRLPPPMSIVFDHQAIVWGARAYSPASALQTLAYFYDPYTGRDRNGYPANNYLNIYIENGGKFWLSGEDVAYILWPLAYSPVATQVPANLTNWDDPIQPHPEIDSAGVTGFLWKLGVEAVDVGAGPKAPPARRNQLTQGCRGFRRVTPAGWEQQSFIAGIAAGHQHTVILHTLDVEDPPGAGVTCTTSETLGHTHAVSLTPAMLWQLARGETIVASTTTSAVPVTHEHSVTLVDQAAATGGPAVLEGDAALWPSIVFCDPRSCPGRYDVEIFNMPDFLAIQAPPLAPPTWRVGSAYTYVSLTPLDPAHGIVYPLTADGQPSVVMARGEAASAHYSRVVCGFEPWRLTARSHLRLAEYILGSQFGLWATP
jgi:hypothetical protein